jgi:uncharacterized delta-60 repeat protein
MLALTNNVPGAQTAFIDTYQFGNYSVSQPLAFTAAQGNGISVTHDTIGSNPLQVTLSVDAGTLTLVHPNPNGGIVYRTGDGYQDSTIVFEGTLADVNTALSWVGYTPPAEQFFQWSLADGGNGHWYRFVSGSKTWTQARDEATAAGGYLATVTSAAENAFVNGFDYSSVGFWLGGYQDRSSITYSEPAGGWRWVTSEPWSYTNWNAGDPNDAGRTEDHLAGNWSSSGKWADFQATNARPGYVVEFNTDPRPAPRTQATLTLSTDDLGFAGAPLTDTDTVTINLTRQPGFADSPNYSTNPAAVDTTFGTNGVVTVDASGGIDSIIDMRVMPDGKIVAVGAVNNRVGLLRFNADGTLDPTFGPNGNGGVQVDLGNGVVPIEMQIDLSGRIVVLTSERSGISAGYLVRFSSSGTLDTTWGSSGVVSIDRELNHWGNAQVFGVRSLRISPEGRCLIAVNRVLSSLGNQPLVAAFQIYGETGFLVANVAPSLPPGFTRAALANQDGTVLVIGKESTQSVLASYSFIESGTVYTQTSRFLVDLVSDFEIRSALSLPDGRILVVGSSNSDFFICRLLSDGRLDTTFGTNGVSRVNVLNNADEGWRATVAADGKILVTGYGFNGVNNDVCIIRMSYDGVVDTSFGSAGLRWLNLGGDDRGYAVATLPDGKILIGGKTGNDIAFVRLLGDGLNPDGPRGIILSGGPVLESAAVGTAVGPLVANDPTPDDTIVFTLVSGAGSDDNGSFTIEGGVVKTAIPLDYETKSSYSIRVRATDLSGLWFEKAVSIDVANVNEPPAAPTVSATTIAENSPVATTIGTLSAVDPDTGAGATFSLVAGQGGDDNAAFAISGSLLRTAVSFDYETKSSYSLRVRAADGGGLFTDSVIVITVTDVNEAPQAVTLSSQTASETLPEAGVVGILGTLDPDVGGTYAYSLVAGAGDDDNAAFAIFGNELRSAVPLDFETKPSLRVRVRSTDQGGLWAETSFVITVTDATPEPPKTISLSSATVAENQPAQTIVGTLSSTDDDAGDTFTYSLVAGGTDNALFSVVGNSLRSAASLDHEAGAVRTIRVRSTDSAGLFRDRDFQIMVTNVNERPTAVTLSKLTLVEGTPANSLVGTLFSVDPDAQETFTYALVAGNGDADNAAFKIVGDQVWVATPSWCKDGPTRSIRVQSTDRGGLSLEAAFTITLEDREFAPSDVRLAPATIEENQPAGTEVGVLAAEDLDGNDGHSFALVTGTGSTDNAKFRIVNGSVYTAAALDFETRSQYSIRVRATDPTGRSVAKPLTISVTDVPEAPTSITLSTNLVFENQPSGTAVGILFSTDPDAGDVPTFSLVDGVGATDNASFTIAGNVLRTARVFDYEAKATHFVRIRATDDGGLSTERAFAVRVRNVIDTVPGPVTIVRADIRGTQLNRSVALRWTAPVNVGDAPIRDYIVQYQRNGSTTWTTLRDGVSVAPSALVAALSGGTSYNFRVAAVNAAGVGPWSTVMQVATPDVRPAVPTGLIATGGVAQAQLSWSPPRNNGGTPIERYIVQYSIDGALWTSASESVSPASPQLTVPSLTRGTRYLFRVAAVNAAGIGAFASRAVLVT